MDSEARKTLRSLLETAKSDPNAELEVKVLPGRIQTPDMSDRIAKAIRARSSGEAKDTHIFRQMYPDGRRVVVETPEAIFKVCSSGSFRGIALDVERKRRYFEAGGTGQDTLDVPDMGVRFTLRQEEKLKRDFQGVPGDPESYPRVIHRKSWRSGDGLFQFDLSQVKSRDPKQRNQTISGILKNPVGYELEIELLDKKADVDLLEESIMGHIRAMIAAYQGSPFILLQTDQKRYAEEWRLGKIDFINPVTMERRHLRAERPGNIMKDYTVTNKADGERSILWVSRDKRLLRINNRQQIVWTGIVAMDDSFLGTVIDGEYIVEHELYCIFDVYKYKGHDTRGLPLLTREDDITRNPKACRLGYARLFVDDTRSGFVSTGSGTPRIETKLFLSGDGPAMEEAIKTLLSTKFEYATDGLIFTPKSSPVAPTSERRGNTWHRVYKWKPADQNSIDFLVRVEGEPVYDTVLRQPAKKGKLFVSRSPGSDIIYPCQQLTGEYVPPTIPADLALIAQVRDRIPSVFQPSVPRDADAYVIYIPVNARGQMVDREGARVDDNTIIECSFDIDTRRWSVMRTRHDKTYKYRVLKEAQFGNDVATADNIWTSIHIPVTQDMLEHLMTSPPDDTYEDELYYREDLDSRDRILRDVYSYHNRIKDSLYKENVRPGSSLLELAVGRAGDLRKWMSTRPRLVVGIDLAESNLTSPRQGACARVLKERAKNPVPPVLFIAADMTKPLDDQDNKYLKLLRGEEPATTPYLETFAGVSEFDAISCQFAIHYACASEETFQAFINNMKGNVLFGTCMDGKAVYSLMLNKLGYIFRSSGKVYAEFTKEYTDSEWRSEFGMGIRVLLESFEKPVAEYLVPFERVTEMMSAAGFQLVHSEMFSELYYQQTDVRLQANQRDFSFLHRSFVFRRAEGVVVDIPEVPKEEVPAEKEEEKKEAEVPVVKRKKKLAPPSDEPPPVLFSVADESKGPSRVFSPEYIIPTLVDGVTYPTTEHYLMVQKARMFADEKAVQKVMKAKSAKSAKGVSIEGAKEEEWDTKKDDAMRVILRAKFTQHPELRKQLLETGKSVLGYANARDKYWSIGTSEDTDKAKNPKKWPGKNMVGVLLMELRETLRGELAGSADGSLDTSA